jgi:hypothetical protein
MGGSGSSWWNLLKYAIEHRGKDGQTDNMENLKKVYVKKSNGHLENAISNLTTHRKGLSANWF